jgi:hypothetical protein
LDCLHFLKEYLHASVVKRNSELHAQPSRWRRAQQVEQKKGQTDDAPELRQFDALCSAAFNWIISIVFAIS